MIAYDRRNGRIDAIVSTLDYAYNYPQEFKDNLSSLRLDTYPDDIFNYRVVDGILEKMTTVEISELTDFDRFLSTEERLELKMLSKLKPSREEVQKAENTIEILELLSEVL